MKKIILILMLVVLLLPLTFAASPSANKEPTLKYQKYGPVFVQGEGIPLDSTISPEWKLAVRLDGQVSSLKEKEMGSGSPIWQARVLRDGDKVITGPNSYAKIILADGSSVIIGPNSVVALNMYQLIQQPLLVSLKVTAGKLLVDMRRFFGKGGGDYFHINTPSSSMASRGTKYEVDVQE
ncbi:MAG: FecR family protein, partial [Nanoarchaeota archaeon]